LGTTGIDEKTFYDVTYDFNQLDGVIVDRAVLLNRVNGSPQGE